MPPARFLTPKLPCTLPLKRPRRGNCDSPFLELPPSCPTGNIPAAKAYFVTPPPLERHRKCPGISEAWYRRRPGGPSRYSAAAVRACGAIPMRAAQGAAAPASNPKRNRALIHARFLPCLYSAPPPTAPVLGGQGGRSPPALLSPHFFGKKWGRPPGGRCLLWAAAMYGGPTDLGG